MKILFYFVSIMTCALTASLATAKNQTAEVAGSVYQDDVYSVVNSNASYTASTRFVKKRGMQTGVGLNITRKTISLQDTDPQSLELLGGNESIDVNGGSVSLDQGLGVGTTVSAFGGLQKSPVNDMRWYGARVSKWWAHDTLQSVLEVRKNDLQQDPLDFTDVDGKRVVTPNEVDGINASLQFTQFATTSTILKYGYSHTTRSDRPDAWSAYGEVRQYITKARGAVHLNYSYYNNVGTIQPITDFGNVIAHSANLIWKQKFGRRVLLTGGYRFHYETEQPRANTGQLNHIGSDYIYTSACFRLNKRPWSQASSEISTMAGYYTSNQPSNGYIFGLGLTHHF